MGDNNVSPDFEWGVKEGNFNFFFYKTPIVWHILGKVYLL